MTAALQIDDLVVDYQRFRAVDQLSLVVKPGEIYGLLGPNGSGKSSTFAAIAGLVTPSAGEIYICGSPASTTNAKMSMGFAPDNLPMPDTLTASETLSFHELLQPHFDRNFADSLMELLGIADHAGKAVSAYSAGMRRKLRLICALAHRPPLLVLDEPFSGLDPVASILIRELLQQAAADGQAVIAATHDLQGAEYYCDRVGILSDGDLVAQGRPHDLKTERGLDSLEDLFIEATGLQGQLDLLRQQLSLALTTPTN